MKDYITSSVTGKSYDATSVVRILNTQQVIAYLNNGVELLDLYPSVDSKTEKPLLVYIFDRNESRAAYDLWCRRELKQAMKKYVEKIDRKYVIATLDIPTQYLRKDVLGGTYCFVDDIEVATKTSRKSIATEVLQYFYRDTGINMELVIVPVDITYEIVDEENEEYFQ